MLCSQYCGTVLPVIVHSTVQYVDSVQNVNLTLDFISIYLVWSSCRVFIIKYLREPMFLVCV